MSAGEALEREPHARRLTFVTVAARSQSSRTWTAALVLLSSLCACSSTVSAGSPVPATTPASISYVVGGGTPASVQVVNASMPTTMNVVEAAGRKLAVDYARLHGRFRHAQLLSFGYAAVTGTIEGAQENSRAFWVAHYRAPFGDLMQDSCPRGRPSPAPTPSTGDVLVLVDPTTGELHLWQTDRREQCGP